MVFLINRTTQKPVLDHIRRAMHFTGRNEALLWLNRQGLDPNDFIIWSESDFTRRYRQLIENENKTRQNANMSEIGVFKVVSESGHTTIVHARSAKNAVKAFCEFFGVGIEAVVEVEEL